MGSTLQQGQGRLAVGAVVGALACTVFAIGVLSDDGAERDPSELGAVEPVPPASHSAGPTVTTSASASSEAESTTATTASTTTTTTTATTTTTTTAKTTTTTTRRTTTTTPRRTTTTTTTTQCHSLICIG